MSITLTGERGTITVTGQALMSLVARSAQRVAGVRVRRSRRRPEIHAADGRIHVALELSAPYGVTLPDVARSVQENVHDVLATMTGLEVEAVDVAVEDGE